MINDPYMAEVIKVLDEKMKRIAVSLMESTGFTVAIQQLLVKKGIITDDEYIEALEITKSAIADTLREEVVANSERNNANADEALRNAEEMIAEFTQTSSAPE